MNDQVCVTFESHIHNNVTDGYWDPFDILFCDDLFSELMFWILIYIYYYWFMIAGASGHANIMREVTSSTEQSRHLECSGFL